MAGETVPDFGARLNKKGNVIAIEVAEIHHPAVRFPGGEANMAASLDFYHGLLGLTADLGRPAMPGVPGFRIAAGETGQSHSIGGARLSRLAKGPDQDPAMPHVAPAVKTIVAAGADLDTRGIADWAMTEIDGSQAERTFPRDPRNAMIELYQADQCRRRIANRR